MIIYERRVIRLHADASTFSYPVITYIVVFTCRSPAKHTASNCYVLVNAALMVFFEQAQSPSVAAVALDCLRHILGSISSGRRGYTHHVSVFKWAGLWCFVLFRQALWVSAILLRRTHHCGCLSNLVGMLFRPARSACGGGILAHEEECGDSGR